MYRIRIQQKRDQQQKHREELEALHGVVGHKRAETLYELAWEYGHSGGWEEVANYYADLVELLR